MKKSLLFVLLFVGCTQAVDKNTVVFLGIPVTGDIGPITKKMISQYGQPTRQRLIVENVHQIEFIRIFQNPPTVIRTTSFSNQIAIFEYEIYGNRNNFFSLFLRYQKAFEIEHGKPTIQQSNETNNEEFLIEPHSWQTRTHTIEMKAYAIKKASAMIQIAIFNVSIFNPMVLYYKTKEKKANIQWN